MAPVHQIDPWTVHGNFLCDERSCKGGRCIPGIAHGGGRRCHIEGCTKLAKEGPLCIVHGGGRRCQIDGCDKHSLKGGRCIAHGGERRCQAKGCITDAWRRGHCYRHRADIDTSSGSSGAPRALESTYENGARAGSRMTVSTRTSSSLESGARSRLIARSAACFEE